MNWLELQEAVGQWSWRNFGGQHGVGALAPLLGATEELGEMQTAPNPDEYADAIADTAIFLLDFSYRIRLRINDVSLISKKSCSDTPVPALGAVDHATLKRIQGIRGFDHPGHYADEIASRVDHAFSSLEYLARQDGHNLRELVEKTYLNIVSKRNWRELCEKTLFGSSRLAWAWLVLPGRIRLTCRVVTWRLTRSWSKRLDPETATLCGPNSLALVSHRGEPRSTRSLGRFRSGNALLEW